MSIKKGETGKEGKKAERRCEVDTDREEKGGFFGSKKKGYSNVNRTGEETIECLISNLYANILNNLFDNKLIVLYDHLFNTQTEDSSS